MRNFYDLSFEHSRQDVYLHCSFQLKCWKCEVWISLRLKSFHAITLLESEFHMGVQKIPLAQKINTALVTTPSLCLTGEVNKQRSNTIHHKYIRLLLILYLASVFCSFTGKSWSDRANPKTNDRFWVCSAHHVPNSLVKTVKSHFRIHNSSQFTVEVGVFTGHACHLFLLFCRL